MIVTSLAMIDIAVRRSSLRDSIRVLLGVGRAERDRTESSDSESDPVASDLLARAPASENNYWRWRRHPQLRVASDQTQLAETERRARHSAVHGLYAGLSGNVEDASAWFLQAVSTHDIDLTEIPSFWQMPRAAIESAAVAYECVGRFREAAMVQARLRSEFRPRNVITLPIPLPESGVTLDAGVAAR